MTASTAEARERLEQALFEIRRVIAGQDAMLERVLVCLLAQGHLLIEGVPGLAKTLTIKTTAGVLGGTFARVQFTPDLVPSDLVGTRIYRPGDGTFDTELGPVFTNFLLADEINRAPAKVQSALLEVMQERQVTIGHDTHPVPDPFLAMATQNPIESEGTYPLPEAQVDRFMLKILIGYPDARRGADDRPAPARERRRSCARRFRSRISGTPAGGVRRSTSTRRSSATRSRSPTRPGTLPPTASRTSRRTSPTAPARAARSASSSLRARSRSCAAATTSLLEDIHALAADALRHRLVLSYQALAEEVTPDTILQRVLAAVPRPQLVLSEPSAA